TKEGWFVRIVRSKWKAAAPDLLPETHRVHRVKAQLPIPTLLPRLPSGCPEHLLQLLLERFSRLLLGIVRRRDHSLSDPSTPLHRSRPLTSQYMCICRSNARFKASRGIS